MKISIIVTVFNEVKTLEEIIKHVEIKGLDFLAIL